MARSRLPDEIKKLQGTLQNCRVNTQAPKPAYGFPVAPSYFTAEERKAWDQACQLKAKTDSDSDSEGPQNTHTVRSVGVGG
jgi:hypothetical protein